MVRKNLGNTYLIALALVLLLALWYCSQKQDTNKEDERTAEKALHDLEDALLRGEKISEVSDRHLQKLTDNIYLVRVPEKEGYTSRSLSVHHPVDVGNSWPQHHYSLPFQYKKGGAWPSNLYTRMRHWSPGFYTGSGWSHYLRPGISYRPGGWPRHLWIKNNDSYYYVTNANDYTHDAGTASAYENTHLWF